LSDPEIPPPTTLLCSVNDRENVWPEACFLGVKPRKLRDGISKYLSGMKRLGATRRKASFFLSITKQGSSDGTGFGRGNGVSPGAAMPAGWHAPPPPAQSHPEWSNSSLLPASSPLQSQRDLV